MRQEARAREDEPVEDREDRGAGRLRVDRARECPACERGEGACLISMTVLDHILMSFCVHSGKR